MNPILHMSTSRKGLVAAAVASVLLAACAATPTAPAGSAEVRAKLSQLQSNPDLASRAPDAMKDAAIAVSLAETPQVDAELASHNVYMADRKVGIASARAGTELAEAQRAELSQARDQSRLDARTLEADAAKSQLVVARASAADAERENAELQRRIDGMNAKATERGLVLNLSDTLFETGRADLKSGSVANLDGLVAFLNSYPDRRVIIEGHTDSIGDVDYNTGLSHRRADSVKSYLMRQGIDPVRLATAGLGESTPIASNDSATGRQQNRRVEVIIVNQTAKTQ